ncbi:putative transposase [Mycena chlorophos]|uniref:Putative transposase n=1 Tax=Mycena chlorophos TaxID=658473 RepID=A0A8H6TNL7_MYCCL|nr:putative transposase [Mycena chlorophos]
MLQRPQTQREKARWVVLLVIAVLQYIILGVGLILSPQYDKMPLHTSMLTGRAWLDELLHPGAHPNRIYIALGMRRHVFLALVVKLRAMGFMESERANLMLDELLAIFLYTCVTGLGIDHVAERFQHSHTTISEHFRKMLDILSSSDFYDAYVRLPGVDDPPPAAIRNNPKWWPFFKDVLGAIDGTHIACTPSKEDIHAARDRKGGVSQNCLAAVSFDMRFLFFTGGWEGCAADAMMYSRAHLEDFPIPAGKMYLADAGFGICDALLVPYRQVQYHLAEWGRAHVRPLNAKELYNLRHASARNVVERIFGVIKHRWTILQRPLHYKMEVQAQIPSALVAVHNFIMEHDNADLDRWIIDEQAADGMRGFVGLQEDEEIDFGFLSTAKCIGNQEKRQAERKRDDMAQAMWADYQRILNERMDVDMDIEPVD